MVVSKNANNFRLCQNLAMRRVGDVLQINYNLKNKYKNHNNNHKKKNSSLKNKTKWKTNGSHVKTWCCLLSILFWIVAVAWMTPFFFTAVVRTERKALPPLFLPFLGQGWPQVVCYWWPRLAWPSGIVGASWRMAWRLLRTWREGEKVTVNVSLFWLGYQTNQNAAAVDSTTWWTPAIWLVVGCLTRNHRSL